MSNNDKNQKINQVSNGHKKYIKEKLPKALDIIEIEREKLKNKSIDSKIDENIKKHENKKQQEEDNNLDKKAKKTKKCSNKKENKSSNKSTIIITLVIFILVLGLSLLFSTMFSLFYKYIYNDKIVFGISIDDKDFSNLTKDDAKKQLEEIYLSKSETPFKISYQENVLEINPVEIQLEYKIDETIDQIYSYGRNNSIFINNYDIISNLFNKKNYDIIYDYKKDTMLVRLNEFAASLPGYKEDPNYVIDGSSLIINSGKEGININIDELIEKFEQKVQSTSPIDKIEVSVITEQPKPIDIEQIKKEVYQEASDAYYTKDPFEIHQEVQGIDFDLEKAKEILANPAQSYTIPLIITKPKVTIDSIGSEAFPDRLGTCTTSFNPGDVGRTQNLRIACNKINGKVLMPGQEFSYNKTLGARTAANGYQYGKVYENGKVVDGIGGGICQISTTLYNAVLKSNLEIVERTNHMFVTSYMKAGLDATVAYGSIDFRFKNNRSYPIRIVASLNGSQTTVSIYGLKSETEYDITFETRQLKTIPNSTEYVEDPSLEIGQEKVVQAGANGSVWETIMIKSLNGKVVESKVISKDSYSPMTRIVNRRTS